MELDPLIFIPDVKLELPFQLDILKLLALSCSDSLSIESKISHVIDSNNSFIPILFIAEILKNLREFSFANFSTS
jgi:hypothetical protein